MLGALESIAAGVVGPWGHWGALWLDLEVLGVGLGRWAHWKQGFGCWEWRLALQVPPGDAEEGTGVTQRGWGQRWRVQGQQDPLTRPSPGLQDGVTMVSQELAGRKGVELDIVEYYSYWHPDPSTMPEPR